MTFTKNGFPGLINLPDGYTVYLYSISSGRNYEG
uniref:Uncharacterized protein n=1 Tax=Siphoviridae sp. ctpLW14 TaxID=2826464 RepID=A0A8S5N8H0_9CAUD|nr:MAG TPA: hypothetical protein [Siphoviridae sp. ctpLW14]